MQTEIFYNTCKKHLKNKDLYMQDFQNYNINRLQQVFKYENLPATIPPQEMERILLTEGKGIFTQYNGNYYIFPATLSGQQDEYNRYTQATVSIPYFNLNKVYNIKDNADGVLIKNDYNMQGVLPIIYKYGSMLCDSEISINSISELYRIIMIITATDNRTKETADEFIKRILNGDFNAILDTGFTDGLKMLTPSTSASNLITQLIEGIQYQKASFYNEIGIQANYNMKRERLSEGETTLNDDILFPLIDEMFSERVNAIEIINEKYSLNIVVDYNSIWKKSHEEIEKETEFTDTNFPATCEENITETETETEQPETETETEVKKKDE